MISGDSIVALSSGRLPAGIAVVRISGPHTLAIADACFTSAGKDSPKPTAARRTSRRPARA